MPSSSGPRVLVRRLSGYGMAVAQAVLLGIAAAVTNGRAEESGSDDQGAQVLTRGPVHEAFAGIVSYNPDPGVLVEKAPPQAIEELPPKERPSGDNITWIPGYWAWDDERSDYLWVSGTWRALPPGRQWTTGYWTTTGQGNQWISGYWADSTVEETTYLPKPPVTVEAGPNVEAPSRDYGWTPGNWMWQQERYAWRPGYWAQGRSDWDWIPAHYVWTPRGYVFVDGYWDYSFNRRGVLYAPVYFQSGYYSRPGYSYSPVVAIGLVALMEHLFLRPNYHHYYFGDYYDRRYSDNGYYSPYAYHSSRYGYDPVYSYRRWTHRQDRDWERRYEASYDYRRNHESARPPRTWADQKRLRLDTAEVKEQQLLMASPLDQMAKNSDSPISLQQVPEKERRQLADVGREVRKNSERRKALETEGVDTAAGKVERDIKPTKVKLPTSPIVGRSPDRFSKKNAPPQTRNSSTAGANKKSDRDSDLEKNRPENKRQEQRDAENKKGQPDSRGPAVPDIEKQQPQSERRADKPPRQEPQAREPKREPREVTRQPARTEEATKPTSRKKSGTDAEDSEQSSGKDRKKEHN